MTTNTLVTLSHAVLVTNLEIFTVRMSILTSINNVYDIRLSLLEGDESVNHTRLICHEYSQTPGPPRLQSSACVCKEVERTIIYIHVIKVGFHYPSSRPEFTGRVDGPRTRVHFLTPVNSGRELG